ncbi:MAG: cation diffusion facilitator family transporter [Thermodesulfobacteriota bacterium]
MEEKRQGDFRAGRRVTLVGVVVNVALIVIKLAAGVWGRSQALIADAIHSLSDLVTDIVVLVGLKLGFKAPDLNHPFGHARLETVASALVGLALIGVAFFIGWDSIRNIHLHAEKHPTFLALAAAVLSILSKEWLYRYTIKVGRRIGSASVQANAWHHRSDALSSVAVVIGVGAAQINPDWHILDAWAALVVALFIVKAGFDVLWGSIREFTDTAPGPEVIGKIEACARGVEGVLGVHDLKVRSSGGRYQMEVHIVVPGGITVIEGHRLAKEVEQCLLEKVDHTEGIIIHVDPAPEEES